jgi:hypothetical protein
MFGCVASAPKCLKNLVADAVQRNPFATAISLLTGKITGYWRIFGPFERQDWQESPVPQRFLEQIPKKNIRDF